MCIWSNSLQFSLVAQSCPTLWIPWTAACQTSLSITKSWGLLKVMSIESVLDMCIWSNIVLYMCIWSNRVLYILYTVCTNLGFGESYFTSQTNRIFMSQNCIGRQYVTRRGISCLCCLISTCHIVCVLIFFQISRSLFFISFKKGLKVDSQRVIWWSPDVIRYQGSYFPICHF